MLYSRRAEEAHAFLLRNHTDLIIYVEDSTCSNVYRCYIKRIIGSDNFRIHKLGSKSEVQSFYSNRAKPKPRRYICIIDGDYGFLFDSNVDAENLHYLRCYCSENLLISKEPIYEILEEIQSDVDIHEFESRSVVEGFISSVIRNLHGLLISYALSQKHAPSIETTGASILKLTRQPNTHQLSKAKINDAIKSQTAEQLRYTNRSTLWRDAREIRRRIVEKSVLKTASGKSMLLPLIYMWLKSHGYRNDIESMKVRMAKHCALNVDEVLLGKITRLAQMR